MLSIKNVKDIIAKADYKQYGIAFGYKADDVRGNHIEGFLYDDSKEITEKDIKKSLELARTCNPYEENFYLVGSNQWADDEAHNFELYYPHVFGKIKN